VLRVDSGEGVATRTPGGGVGATGRDERRYPADERLRGWRGIDIF
jgi:hypothetical protein